MWGSDDGGDSGWGDVRESEVAFHVKEGEEEAQTRANILNIYRKKSIETLMHCFSDAIL